MKEVETGQKFGMLTVMHRAPSKQHGDNRRYYFFRCECGTVAHRRLSEVLRGNSFSCGCVKRKRQKNMQPTGNQESMNMFLYGCKVQEIRTPENARYYRGMIDV